MDFLTLKALHIIFIVTWFAGLFYIVRLFIYHTEAQNNEQLDERAKSVLCFQFKIMEKRLWYGITTPSFLLTLACGTLLLSKNWAHYITQPWMYLKLSLLAGLIVYHWYCGRIFNKLQKNEIPHSSLFLRFFNEIATVFLVCIVFTALFKNTLSPLKALLGLIVFSALLVLGIWIYRKNR